MRTLTQDKAGGYLLGGSSSSGKSGDKSQKSQGGMDYWLVKINPKGDKLWDKRYGGSGAEELRALIQTSDEGLLLGGRSSSGVSGDRTQPSQGENDFWLVKLAPNSTSLVAEKEASQEPELMKADELSSLTVYPNPSSELVTISFTLPKSQVATIKVYDSQGREITTLFRGKAEAKQAYQIEWQASNQLTGLYLLRLYSASKSRTTKLLLTR